MFGAFPIREGFLLLDFVDDVRSRTALYHVDKGHLTTVTLYDFGFGQGI
jgi:hypothetical protein